MAFLYICCLMALAITSGNAVYPGNIPGPKMLNESIAIIGGSMTALHMAYLLKNRQFSNIEVIVQDSRLGGDEIFSFDYRGTSHELGKFMMIPSGMSEELDALMSRYTQGQLNEIVLPTVWKDNNQFQSLDAYLLEKTRPFYPGVNDNDIKNRLVQKLAAYSLRVNSLLGQQNMLIPNEPQWMTKFQLDGNFEQFLQRNNFRELSPLFTYLFGMLGYGRCEDYPALYGIYFLKDKLLDSLKRRLQGDSGVKGYKMNTRGFQALIDRMALVESLNIVRNVKINEIMPTAGGKYRIDMKINNVDRSKQYDFLIFADDLKDYVKLNKGRKFDEYQNFLRPQTKYLVKTLVDSINVNRGDSPIEFYSESFNAGAQNDYRIAFAVDSYAAHRRNEGVSYRLNSFQNSNNQNDPNQQRKSAVYTQMSNVEPNIAVANSMLRNVLLAKGGRDIVIQKTQVYKFFPYYEDSDLNNGMLYELLKMQGKNNIWYIGKSAFLDDLTCSIAYNKMILDKYRRI